MKLILHFGLHRSASSALQRVLNERHRPLRKRRVLALSQRTAQREPYRTFTLINGIHIGARGPRSNFARIETHLKAIAAEFDAVIFSDENMPGLMIGDRGGAFSRADRFAAMLGLLAGTCEVHTVAILRKHADWLESIHRFAAWHGEPRDFPAFIARADLSSVSYCGLLDAVAGAVGRERLHVFSYDAVKRDGGKALLWHMLELAGTRLPMPLQLPLANVSADARFIALMQTLHARGVVLPRLTTVALKERLLLPDAAADSEGEIVETLTSAARRVLLPVASMRAYRWAQRALDAGLPLAGIPEASAKALVGEALASAAKASGTDEARAALKRQLDARFAADREAVGRLYLPAWRGPAGSGEVGEFPPDAVLDLAR